MEAREVAEEVEADHITRVCEETNIKEIESISALRAVVLNVQCTDLCLANAEILWA